MAAPPPAGVTVTQRRHHSALEALASTAVGFLISFSVWPPISVHILHRPPAVAEGLGVIGIYTAISVVRGYVMRRFFNRLHEGKRERCAVCQKPAVITCETSLCAWHARADR